MAQLKDGTTIGGNTALHTGNFTDSSANWNTAYGWGNHASAGYISTTAANAAYQAAGNYFTDGDTVLNMTNNDGLVYDDATNKMYVRLDGTNREIYHTGNFTDSSANWNTAYGWGDHGAAGYAQGSFLGATAKAADSELLDGINSTSFLRSDAADTASGRMTFTGGVKIQGGSAGDAAASELLFDGSNSPQIKFRDSDTTQDDFYIHVNSSNFYILTDRDNNDGWDGAHPLQLKADTNQAYIFGNEVKSAAYQASTAFDAAGSADTVNLRIDEEVLPAIPTNNNQLTNGAGYITDGNTNWNNSYGFITEASYIKAGGAGPSTENLNTIADSVVTGELEYRGFSLASSNRPPASDNANGVITVGQHSGNYNAQLAFSSDGNMYWRDNPSSSFGDWRTIWDSGNLDAFVGATVSNDTITFTKANGGTVAVTTSDADTNTWRPIDDTPVNGVTDQSISSNWAYDHVNASNPHGTTAADVGADPVGSAAAVNTALSEEIGNLSTAVSTNTTGVATNRTAITTNATNISALSTSISTGSVTIGNGVTLSESSDRADLLYINSGTSTWGGLQIGNTSNEFIFSLMGDGNVGGIYDDANSDWIIYWAENAGVELKHNTNTKLTTTADGVTVTGYLTVSNDTGVKFNTSGSSGTPTLNVDSSANWNFKNTVGTNVVTISNGGALVASGDVTAFSDARVKENVETLPNALESVKQMRGVVYNKIGADTQSVGVIAQELEEVVPQLVHTDEEGMKSVAYGNITAVLIEALKEQQVQIEELKAKLDGLTK